MVSHVELSRGSCVWVTSEKAELGRRAVGEQQGGRARVFFGWLELHQPREGTSCGRAVQPHSSLIVSNRVV